MRRRAIYILTAVVLFPILEKAGIECSQHGFAIVGSAFAWVADILKLVFLVLLILLCAGASRLHPNRAVQALIAIVCVPLSANWYFCEKPWHWN